MMHLAIAEARGSLGRFDAPEPDTAELTPEILREIFSWNLAKVFSAGRVDLQTLIEERLCDQHATRTLRAWRRRGSP
jgi:hypothetical protein